MPSGVLSRWVPTNDHSRRKLTDEDYADIRRGDAVRMKITKALHDVGAKILLGTDTDNPFVVPGFSIHEELQNLVSAGLSPFEAITAGTKDAADFLKDNSGTVEVGKRADLLLLEDNPLQDVKNIAKKVGVMVRGQWLSTSNLNNMLENARKNNQVAQK